MPQPRRAPRAGRFLRGALACLLGTVLVLLLTEVGQATPPTTVEGVPALSHVFTIVLENEPFDATYGPGSPANYLNSLRSQGVLLTQYYGVGHASNDNYISMTSGQPPVPLTMADCSNWLSCEQAVSSPAFTGGASIAEQFESVGRTWKGYMEDMPAPCTHASATTATDPYQGDSTQARSYNYADRHNPFIYYGPVVNNTARCATHDVPYSQLARDMAGNTVPNYAFIVPNTCDDGHDVPTCANGRPGGLVAADAWLAANVPPPKAPIPPATVAAGDTDGRRGFHVPSLVISPWSQRGGVSHLLFDHTSVLRMIEWRWNLKPLTVRDATAANLASALNFSAPDIPAPQFAVPPGPFGAPCPIGSSPATLAEEEWGALRTLATTYSWP